MSNHNDLSTALCSRYWGSTRGVMKYKSLLKVTKLSIHLSVTILSVFDKNSKEIPISQWDQYLEINKKNNIKLNGDDDEMKQNNDLVEWMKTTDKNLEIIYSKINNLEKQINIINNKMNNVQNNRNGKLF